MDSIRGARHDSLPIHRLFNPRRSPGTVCGRNVTRLCDRKTQARLSHQPVRRTAPVPLSVCSTWSVVMMNVFLGCRGGSTLTTSQWAANMTAVRLPHKMNRKEDSQAHILACASKCRLPWCLHAPVSRRRRACPWLRIGNLHYVSRFACIWPPFSAVVCP